MIRLTSGFSMISCVLFIALYGAVIEAHAQTEPAKPVIAWIDQDSNLVTGDEVVFRDPETLKKVLRDLRLSLPHNIPELGVQPEALEAAKVLAGNLEKKIEAEWQADRLAQEKKPEGEKDPNYTPRAEFRRMATNWAFSISQLAMSDEEVLNQIDHSVEASEEGDPKLFKWRLRNAALLAVDRGIDPQVFLDKAKTYRSQGTVEIALDHYFSGAIAGSGQALKALVELMSEDLTYIPSSEYLQLLAIMRPEGTTELMHRFLDHYMDEVSGIRAKTQKPHMLYREAMGIILAIGYISAYGSDLDREQLAGLPIPNALLWNSLFWVMTDNAGVLYDQLNPNNEFFQGYCLSLMYREQEAATKLLQQYIEHGVRARYAPEEIDRFSYTGVGIFFDKNMSRCMAKQRMANDIWDIHKSDYANDLFWVKQDGAYEKTAAAFQSKTAARGQLTFVDYFDDKFLVADGDAEETGDREVTPTMKLLQAYLSLTENTHRFDDYEYSVGRAERRSVYRALKESPAISLGAIVDMIPRLNNDKLQVGIKLDATFGVGPTAGLAVMIGGHDKTMQAYSENSALTLIERVLLEKDGKQTTLTYLRTTAGGTHIYETPEADANAFRGLLSVRMKAFDESWDLNFPLVYSQYALRHRLSSSAQK